MDGSIGSEQVTVVGYDQTGREQRLLRADRWQFLIA